MARIAVIGTGISGMAAAWLLSRSHELTVFEAPRHVGGHTHTHRIDRDYGTYAIDTGFIVYNDWTYPDFIRLLDRLGVESQPTEMSFSVRNDAEDLEYNGHSLLTMFAQRSNLLRPAFYRMIRDILRFNREARQMVTAAPESLTLAAYLEEGRYSREFTDWYIRPMAAAIWSAGTDQIGEFPLRYFAAFFNNHGLLNISDRPQWRVIRGGSNQYVLPLTRPYRERIRCETPVTGIRRTAAGVQVTARGKEPLMFDHVVIATHSNQALAMLEDATPAEQEVLGSIDWAANEVVLHTDTSLLPRRRPAWASWNYNLDTSNPRKATVTYNMNILQGLQAPETFCVSLNPSAPVDESRVIRRLQYDHPVYNHKTIAVQARRKDISGVNRTHYCGAYWDYGFHEDGLRSALRVAEFFGERLS